MRLLPLPSVLSCLAALLLSACPQDPPATPCKVDKDCPAGQGCLDARCTACPACKAGEVCLGARCLPSSCGEVPCPEKQACVQGRCVTSVCLGVNCPSGQGCAGGQCYPAECPAEDCSITEVCLSNDCQPTACVGVTCAAGTQCGNGDCLPTTCTSAGCASGAVCDDGKCVDARCVGVICRQGALCSDGRCVPASCGASPCPAGEVCASGTTCSPATCVGVTCPPQSVCAQDACAKCAATEARCADRVDDDCDGQTDCADLDCASASSCACGGVACPAPSRCVAQKCLPGSCGSRPCPAGEGCLSGICQGAACVALACATGTACVNGACHPLDCGGPACPMGEVCSAAACVPASCLTLTCSNTQVCADGACWPKSCPNNRACADGTACVNDECIARSCVGITCSPGELCVLGTCRPTSCSSGPCPAGQACVANACVDPGCAAASCPSGKCRAGVCEPCAAGETRCGDGIDEDCDGLTDCADSSCSGQACTTSHACSKAGTCSSGTCSGEAPLAAGTVCRAKAGDCDAAETCDGTRLDCPADALAATGAACPDDGNSCTNDRCDGAGKCTHPAKADGAACGTGLTCRAGACGSGCTIGGTAYASGAKNPANSCQVCLPATSTSAWTPAAANSACADDSNACTADVCDASGTCLHNPQPDGSSCGSGQTCRGGQCGTGCLIGGVPYASSAPNPATSCQVCDPARSPSAWSNLANGTACATDGNACTTDACDAAGACQHAAKTDGTSCGIGQSCRSGICGSGCTIGGTPYAANDKNPANACQLCDPLRSATAWSNAGGSTACTTDNNPCTADLCDGAGACQHGVLADGAACTTGSVAAGVCSTGTCQDGCFIASGFVAAGTENPANECQACLPGTSRTAWSNQPAATPCTSDANACTTDVCDAGGVCRHNALPNGSSCGGALTCSGGLCGAGCTIASVHYDSGPNPANVCQVCDPAIRTNGWSNASNSTPCPDDGNACTDDRCDGSGACGHVTRPDGADCATGVCRTGTCSSGCFIAGTYYAAGAPNPGNACQACDPAASRTGWSFRPDTTACATDGNACTGDFCNGAGSCQHVPVADGGSCAATSVCVGGLCQAGCFIDAALQPPGAPNPTNDCEQCLPATNKAAWSDAPAATACGEDGNLCTTDRCDGAGTCTHPASANGSSCGTAQWCVSAACQSGCYIGGAFYFMWADNPGNECQRCDTAVPTVWSPKANGSDCTDDLNVCTSDTCSGGTCQHPAMPDGNDCGPGQICRLGICSSGCTIEGTFYAANAVNPATVCQGCDPAASKYTWSPRNAAGACESDGDLCTTDVCDSGGGCSHAPKADGDPCGSGQICYANVCQTGCLVGGTLWQSGRTNPSNICDKCIPATSTSSWSPNTVGTACATDDDECTADACDANGTCLHTPLPPGSACGSVGYICYASRCDPGCYISGAFYTPAQPNPADACDLCTPATSTSAWTSGPAGTPCADDADPCTTDQCNASGTCLHTRLAEGTTCGPGLICHAPDCEAGCWIGGAFRTPGEANPADPCAQCIPAMSTTVWSHAPQGTACATDNNACTVDECNLAGACVHNPMQDGDDCGGAKVCLLVACTQGCWVSGNYYADGTTNPQASCERCVATTAKYAWTDKTVGDPCTEDGDPCTDDACAAGGVCAHPPRPEGSDCGSGNICHTGSCVPGCYVDGGFHAPFAVNPLNECQSCDPANPFVWRNEGGLACTDDGNACTTDRCSSAGVCEHDDVTNGTQCDPGDSVCYLGTCTQGCFLGGSLYADGERNPLNECEQCDASNSTFDWSPVGAGAACTDDGEECTDDTCNGSGACTHPPVGDGALCGSNPTICGGEAACHICDAGQCILNSPHFDDSCTPSCGHWATMCGGTTLCCSAGDGCAGAGTVSAWDCAVCCVDPPGASCTP